MILPAKAARIIDETEPRLRVGAGFQCVHCLNDFGDGHLDWCPSSQDGKPAALEKRILIADEPVNVVGAITDCGRVCHCRGECRYPDGWSGKAPWS